MKSNLAEQKRLDEDIEKAEERLNEILSRLARLRRQRRVARERGSELFRRGMREVDDEDGVRSQEEAIIAEQHAVGEAQLAGAFGAIDWDFLGFDGSGETSSGAVAHAQGAR